MFLSAIVNASDDAILSKTLDGILTTWNHAAERMFGYAAEEIIGKPKTILFPPDRLHEEEVILDRLQRGLATDHFETIRLHKDGTPLDVSVTISPIKDANGRVIGASTIARDITERKRATDALCAQEMQFRLLFADNPHPMWVYDLETLQFLEVNDATIALYGYSRDEFLQMRSADIRLNEEAGRRLHYNSSEVPGLQRSSEEKHRRKNGEVIDVEITSHQLDFEGRRGVLVVAQDVTERKRLENQLLQAQKMESVGRLAGGVAHDFNNFLSIIIGYAELAQEDCDVDARGQEYLSGIVLAAEKAANLTRQLLSFARRQVIKPETIDLNDLILSLDKMLRRVIAENIELVMLPEEELHPVKVDPSQFEQILVNLVVNARDAMPKGGKITIETNNITLDDEYARHHSEVVPGEYVMLAVSDTGVGMDEGARLHIFEPFFTTKEKGRGTGLGLATVYGIVRQAGGHIWLYSEPGEGTTFKIYLPRTGEAPPVLTAPLRLPDRTGGSETLLLVEDEPSVRALAVQMLRSRGYTVLKASNGEEALRRVKGREHEIALLVTDVVMPQMSGKELAERLLSIHSGLKVLYASGYTENTIVHHGALETGVAFLSKPFTPTMLARKVREVLDRQ